MGKGVNGRGVYRGSGVHGVRIRARSRGDISGENKYIGSTGRLSDQGGLY